MMMTDPVRPLPAMNSTAALVDEGPPPKRKRDDNNNSDKAAAPIAHVLCPNPHTNQRSTGSQTTAATTIITSDAGGEAEQAAATSVVNRSIIERTNSERAADPIHHHHHTQQQQGQGGIEIMVESSSEIDKKCLEIVENARKAARISVAPIIGKKVPLGVVRPQPFGNYEARIYFYGQDRHIGSFETVAEARMAYIFARIEFDAIHQKTTTRKIEEGGGGEGLTGDDPSPSAKAAVEVQCNDIIENARKAARSVSTRGDKVQERLPRGVSLGSIGQYKAHISLNGKTRLIGSFATVGQARIAYGFARFEFDQIINSQKEGLEDISLEVNKKCDDIIESIRKAAGSNVDEATETELPRGVTRRSNGKYEARIFCQKKTRFIGFFDTPGEAGIAFIFARTKFDQIKKQQKGLENDIDPTEVENKCNDMIKNIRKAAGFSVDGAIEEELPRGVNRRAGGKYEVRTYFLNKTRYIGFFATAVEAGIAFAYARTKFDEIKKLKGVDDPSEGETKCDDTVHQANV